jgi:hypothetical protein
MLNNNSNSGNYILRIKFNVVITEDIISNNSNYTPVRESNVITGHNIDNGMLVITSNIGPNVARTINRAPIYDDMHSEDNHSSYNASSITIDTTGKTNWTDIFAGLGYKGIRYISGNNFGNGNTSSSSAEYTHSELLHINTSVDNISIEMIASGSLFCTTIVTYTSNDGAISNRTGVYIGYESLPLIGNTLNISNTSIKNDLDCASVNLGETLWSLVLNRLDYCSIMNVIVRASVGLALMSSTFANERRDDMQVHASNINAVADSSGNTLLLELNVLDYGGNTNSIVCAPIGTYTASDTLLNDRMPCICLQPMVIMRNLISIVHSNTRSNTGSMYFNGILTDIQSITSYANCIIEHSRYDLLDNGHPNQGLLTSYYHPNINVYDNNSILTASEAWLDSVTNNIEDIDAISIGSITSGLGLVDDITDVSTTQSQSIAYTRRIYINSNSSPIYNKTSIIDTMFGNYNSISLQLSNYRISDHIMYHEPVPYIELNYNNYDDWICNSNICRNIPIFTEHQRVTSTIPHSMHNHAYHSLTCCTSSNTDTSSNDNDIALDKRNVIIHHVTASHIDNGHASSSNTSQYYASNTNIMVTTYIRDNYVYYDDRIDIDTATTRSIGVIRTDIVCDHGSNTNETKPLKMNQNEEVTNDIIIANRDCYSFRTQTINIAMTVLYYWSNVIGRLFSWITKEYRSGVTDIKIFCNKLRIRLVPLFGPIWYLCEGQTFSGNK